MKNIHYIAIILLFASVAGVLMFFNQEEPADISEPSSSIHSIDEESLAIPVNDVEEDYYVNDITYRWDDQLLNWVDTRSYPEGTIDIISPEPEVQRSGPIKVDWELLMDIEYRLKYFSEIDAEMFAPVFKKEVQALHGKLVTIEGYVIPFEAEEEILSLSYNPYAACFFCGKASPASIISLFLKKKKKKYKIDDYKTFKGILYLNEDDPNQFYYILRDAKEI